MKRWREHPILAATLGLAALVVAGEIGCLRGRVVAARAAAMRCEQLGRESAQLFGVAPAPTPEVAAAVAADLAQAVRVRAAMQAGLSGRGPAAGRWLDAPVPAARTDAYFDLADFVERMRASARRNGVDVRSEAARFGFAAHVNEAPEPARIAAVFRQRLVAEYLLEALFEARPQVLHRFQRERAATARERAARHRRRPDSPGGERAEHPPAPDEPLPLSAGPDFFVVEPRRTARVPGTLDTMAFRLVFSGPTAALRLFLNRLGRFDLPVLVREIEVKPATPGEIAVAADAAAMREERPLGESTPDGNSEVLRLSAVPPRPAVRRLEPAPSGVAPIVVRPFSTFTVTVELVELWPRPAGATAEVAPES